METYIIDDYDSDKYIDASKEIIFAKGGDGTLLKAINKFRHFNKPFFGIAAGTENFLMNKFDEISEDAKYKKFTLINVKVTYQKDRYGYSEDGSRYWNGSIEGTKEFQAFNDICLGGDMNSWIDFNVHDSDRIIGKFKGGGIVISTAQGSTGINKNNGGNILPLNSNLWYVTGDKTNRHISVPIEPKRTSITCDARTPVTLWVDGSNHIIENVEKIEISKGDIVTVIFNDYDEFKRKRRV